MLLWRLQDHSTVARQGLILEINRCRSFSGRFLKLLEFFRALGASIQLLDGQPHLKDRFVRLPLLSNIRS